MKVQEGTVYKLLGQKTIEDEYKEQDMLLKVNKANMAGTTEAIKEYLWSCHSTESNFCLMAFSHGMQLMMKKWLPVCWTYW